jgi:hypothetical protein
MKLRYVVPREPASELSGGMSGEPSSEPSYKRKEVEVRRNEKEKEKNSLRLVHPSPNGKNKNQPRREREDIEDCDHVITDDMAADICGLSPVVKKNIKNAPLTKSEKWQSGRKVFILWHKTVKALLSEVTISMNPTDKQIENAAEFNEKFGEFSADDLLPAFLEYLIKNWGSAYKFLVEMDAFPRQNISYPEIQTLSMHSNHIFTWYRRQEKDLSDEAEIKRVSNKRCAQQTETRRTVPAAPYKGCKKLNCEGRTFDDTDISIEYRIATCIKCNQITHRYDHSQTIKPPPEKLRVQLSKNAISLQASEARIDALLKLPSEEFDEYCC